MKTNILIAALFPLALQIAMVSADPTTAPASQPTSQPTSQATVITWDTAKKHLGETVTVTGPVMGTHAAGTEKLLLNIGKDYPDKSRLTVMIQGTASEADYKDKTVTVTGKVEMYKGAPEMKVKPTDVTIEK